MKRITSVLLGGVPFGCDNVGDEAILACVVRILRELRPELELTASTGDEAATAERLGIGTIPLLGFEDGGVTDRSEIRRQLAAHDLYLWSGATGLSDYPHVAVSLLEAAQRVGKRTGVFCTGMNRELNPDLYRLNPGGPKARALGALGHLAFGLLDDPVASFDARVDRRMRGWIARVSSAANLVVLRDPESCVELGRTPPALDLVVGADPALLLEPAPRDAAGFGPELEAALQRWPRRLGLCISAQRAVTNLEGLVGVLDALLSRHPELGVFFLPMNPITDAELMEGLRDRLSEPGRTQMLTGRHEPEVLALAASLMDVVVSSRLHLLILAANAHVPIVGIGRGSKVANFLRPYGLQPAGEAEGLDLAALESEVNRLLGPDAAAFRSRSRVVRGELLHRLGEARAALGALLDAGAP